MIFSGNGSKSGVITSTGTQIKPLLAGTGGATVTYNDPSDTPAASTTLTLTVHVYEKAGASGDMGVSGVQTIDITAVNDAPVATAPSTHYSATEQTDLALQGTGLSISDVDAASGSMTVTLAVGEGTLTLAAGSTGATIFSGNGTNSVVITGTVTQINALLAGTGGATVTYNDPSDTPAASTTLTLTVHDNGNTGTGGDKSSSASST